MRRRLLEAPRESCNDEVNKRMLRAAKILERMVNQNTYDEIAQGILFQGFIMSHGQPKHL